MSREPDRPDLLDWLLVEAVSQGRLTLDQAADVARYADSLEAAGRRGFARDWLTDDEGES